MRLIKLLLIVAFILTNSTIFCQDQGVERSKGKTSAIIEIGYVNPIHFSSNINSSHHENWNGVKLEWGVSVQQKFELTVSYTKLRSVASKAYFPTNKSSNKIFVFEMRYKMPLSPRFAILPKVVFGATTWNNGIELIGQRYGIGGDILYSTPDGIGVKFKLDMGYDSYNERLPESLDRSFSGIYIQPGLSIAAYL